MRHFKEIHKCHMLMQSSHIIKNIFITRLQCCDHIHGSNIWLLYLYGFINSSVFTCLEIWGRLHVCLRCGLYQNSLQIVH